jgi:hypothetical protein
VSLREQTESLESVSGLSLSYGTVCDSLPPSIDSGDWMWTKENRARYDRSRLRYESDLTDAEWAEVVH